MVHMSIDNDIHLEGMCNKCKHEAEQKKCNTCGSNITDEMDFNPNFDEEYFNSLKNQQDDKK